MYRDHASYVAAALRRLSVPDEAIKDAVQDVFVVAFRRWADFDPSRAPRPWLTGIARYVAFRHRRSAARRRRRGLAWAAVAADRAQRGPHHQANARDFLTRFLETMDPDHRQAFVLAELEGRTGQEVASALGISPDAAYGRVRTVRRQLKRALMNDVGEGDPRAAGLVPPWALVAAKLPGGKAVAATSSSAVLGSKLGLGTVATIVAVVVVSAGVQFASDKPSGQRVSPTTEPAPAPIERPRPAQLGIVDARVESPRPNPEPLKPSVERGKAQASPARAGARRKEVPDPAPTETPTTASLRGETALLAQAKRLLERAKTKQALAVLSEHAHTFPQGQLATARRRLRIRALCDLGRSDQAQREASRIAAASPGDPLAIEASSICNRSSVQKRATLEKKW